eukprot:TRINITY_DN11070_c0_g1_i1.p1 TRINITY_DN11070_c0_g1~~TRINITY_DN11070_c0_g1_i1.p1  ORF type:complete len:240 (-),score=42.14 TRINITY_DN11070_c0_g1_i1:156-875(-)
MYSQGQKIYITRHAQRLDWVSQNWNQNGQQCNFNSPLSEIGKKQAKQLAHWLAQNCNISHIFSSPFSRTIVTAHEIAEQFDCKINIEFGVSEWEHRQIHTIDHLTDDYYLQYTHRKCPHYQSLVVPNQRIESTADIHHRARHLVKQLDTHFNGKGDIIFVCHAASHIALTRAFLNDVNLEMNVGTCAITILERVGDGWKMIKNGSLDHIDDEFKTPTVLSVWGFSQKEQSELERFSFET